MMLKPLLKPKKGLRFHISLKKCIIDWASGENKIETYTCNSFSLAESIGFAPEKQ